MVVILQLQVVHQCSLQIGPAVEASLLQQFVDTAVEALDHAVRLWGAAAVLDDARQVFRRKPCHRVLAARLFILVAKRSINCEPLSARILLILMGEASFKRRRKSTQLLSVMSP